MQSQYQAVVIGGGVVGCSVLYHLAKFGWTDICLIERSVLTAGSSWHAAGGIHALNADPNMSALQAYTINLLAEIEKESGQSIGLQNDRWDQCGVYTGTVGMAAVGLPDIPDGRHRRLLSRDTRRGQREVSDHGYDRRTRRAVGRQGGLCRYHWHRSGLRNSSKTARR
ncbi:MAG: hypothetical protein Ct9H300mP16_13360 [Pseudomonadota bacterium]|nr:MAG: hypothetical protein Ct9H300mP16_13360 [Pseudomonadota bacterium]